MDNNAPDAPPHTGWPAHTGSRAPPVRTPSKLAARAVGLLEQWFLQRPLRFVLCAVLLSLLWTALLYLLVPEPPAPRPLQPVLAPRAPGAQLLHVLVAAPLLENALLWAVFRAAGFALPRRDSLPRNVLAIAVPATAFALAHYPFKALYGAEVFALAWLIAACFFWGRRHRQAWRGFGLSVAVHFGVNLVAIGLFHL